MKRLFLTLALISIAGCASSPQQKAQQPAPPPSFAPSYATDMGTSPVGVIPSALLRDTTRNKDVEVSIEYPTRGTGPFPIIIFSPGYGGSRHADEALISYWASYWYVFLLPLHPHARAPRGTKKHPPPKKTP